MTAPLPSPLDNRAVARTLSEIADLLAETVSIRQHLTVLSGSEGIAEVSRLAEQALAVDPAHAEWQEISSRLGALREAMAAGASRETLD